MTNEMQTKLNELAFKKTIPFCYSCYEKAPSGRCQKCGSDDLMRLLPESGCDWGVDWVIKEILQAELSPADLSEAFEESVRSCYPETVQVGWLELDTVTVLKSMDPVSWDIAQSEYESEELDSETIVTFDNGSTYYWTHEVEALLDSAT